MIDLLKTGIPKLDSILEGGIPEGVILTYLNEPAVESEIFIYQTFFEQIKSGRKGIFLTSVKPPDHVIENFEKYGWNIESYRNNIVIIDGYSALIGTPSEADYIIKRPDDIDEILETLERALNDHPNAVTAILSLSTIIDYCGEDKFVENFPRLKEIMKKSMLGLFSVTEWPYDEKTLEVAKDVDCVVIIRGVEERVIFGQYFAVLTATWLDANRYKKRSTLFKVTSPGGVKVYLPKILVTGPFNAGKSTFVHSLSTKAVSVERLGTTVAIDHGHVDHEGITTEVFGTPGQERFDPILKQLASGAIGVIIIIDSTQLDTIPRAKEMMRKVWKEGLPLIIAANKQDLPGAVSPEEMKEALKIPERIQVVPCTATDRDAVLKVFDTLIESIMRRDM